MGCVSFICFILQNDEKLSKRVVVFEFLRGAKFKIHVISCDDMLSIVGV